MVLQLQKIQYLFSVIQAGLSQINYSQSLCTMGALNSFDPFRLPDYGHVSAITASLWPTINQVSKDASLYVIICKISDCFSLECEFGIFLFLPFLQSSWFVYAFYVFLFLYRT